MDAGFVTELIDRLARLVANASLAEGLKPAQWEVLRYLAIANRFSRTPGNLALWLGSTKGTVSQTVNSLESRNLLTKQKGSDRRSVQLTLTAKGMDTLKRDELARVRTSIAAMDEASINQLGAELHLLLRKLIAANGSKPFGVCQTCRHFSTPPTGPAHYCLLLKETLTTHDASLICVEQEAA